MRDMESSILEREHVESWNTLWNAGTIETSVTENGLYKDLPALVAASRYEILSVLREDHPAGLSPLSLGAEHSHGYAYSEG